LSYERIVAKKGEAVTIAWLGARGKTSNPEHRLEYRGRPGGEWFMGNVPSLLPEAWPLCRRCLSTQHAARVMGSAGLGSFLINRTDHANDVRDGVHSAQRHASRCQVEVEHVR